MSTSTVRTKANSTNDSDSSNGKVSDIYLIATGAGILFASVASIFTPPSSVLVLLSAAIGCVVGYWISKKGLVLCFCMNYAHLSVLWFGENIRGISAVCALSTASAYLLAIWYRGGEWENVISPCLSSGFVASHFPTALILVASGVNTDYLRFLESQRIPVALSGVAIAIFVVQTIGERFRSGTSQSGAEALDN